MEIANFIITGVTGLVGQHILYELLRKHLEGKMYGKIIVLIRGANQEVAQNRLVNLLTHPEIPEYLRFYSLAKKLEPIEVIAWSLGQPITLPQFLQLKKSYCLIHLASSLDLSRDQTIYSHLRKVNLEGTLNLVRQLSPFLNKVTFIGTAYTLVDQQEIIENPEILGERTYRNPYERVKAQTELVLKDYCRAINLETQIIRLGTICGRLMDSPHYYTPKFDVFYGFCRFFYLTAQKKRQESCRILADAQASLNITSCDYAAKGILAALNSDVGELTVGHSKNLVNYVPRMLAQVGFTNYEIVSQVPKDPNKLEKYYYRVFGMTLSIYTFYRYNFDVSILRRLMPDIQEPDVEGNFPQIIQYANQRNYRNLEVIEPTKLTTTI